MRNLFGMPKWMELLPRIKGNSVSDMVRHTTFTYSHAHRIIDGCVERGWVKAKTIGRCKICRLTPSGHLLAFYVYNIGKRVKKWEERDTH